MSIKKGLPAEKTEELINLLKSRFEKNMKRHQELKWKDVEIRLRANQHKFGRLTKWKKQVVSPM